MKVKMPVLCVLLKDCAVELQPRNGASIPIAGLIHGHHCSYEQLLLEADA